MKRKLLVFAFILIGYCADAQEVGVRFGKVTGNNVALDVMFSSGKYSRIHGDVSFGNGVGVDLLWDFLYRPMKGEAFHWYAGIGPSVLIHDPFKLGISGEGGIEYTFNKAPITLGLDWRPSFYLIEDTEFDAGGFGFNARYVFGKK